MRNKNKFGALKFIGQKPSLQNSGGDELLQFTALKLLTLITLVQQCSLKYYILLKTWTCLLILHIFTHLFGSQRPRFEDEFLNTDISLALIAVDIFSVKLNLLPKR